ncbi:acyltransferase [Salinarchaeum sp. IM2453]|uniref:acyltransferase n=1 Tax=Salinarchaeum sp. IM2453 TaxID=2862870 RepID=UPI001C831D92|nr:acyltransferase [Salinarchaeum sp. IM2453]QZA89090.1 acyltransferase [Salinarchaeum sp. IM2453]
MDSDPRERFENWRNPDIEDGELTKYNWVVNSPENLELAEYVDIGAFTVINAHAGVVIEEGVQIGSHCAVHSRSTIDQKQGKVRIEEGAKVGSHTVILPGVRIGKNAVIGAQSLVNDDVSEGEVVAGVPAEELNS